MKLTTSFCLLIAASAGFGALGCSSSDDSSSSNDTGGTGGSGATVAPGSHGENESCPDGVSDCAQGLQCDTGDPNGQCYKTCTPGGGDAQCGDNAVCNFEGHCYSQCTKTSDCARASEGYTCQDDQPPRSVMFCDGP
ncbi:MAG TPA: hypothetical protein VHW01_00055 [Polyangiaceae bacterium]|jgi:hypothetical protein|nr:hypothetical protein [Polyangiaceae bacterium]